eukprot:1880520-Amphidinium_carterae.1
MLQAWVGCGLSAVITEACNGAIPTPPGAWAPWTAICMQVMAGKCTGSLSQSTQMHCAFPTSLVEEYLASRKGRLWGPWRAT